MICGRVASLALQAGADLKDIRDSSGTPHRFTADTCISVMPQVAHDTAEAVAQLVLRAGDARWGNADRVDVPARLPTRLDQTRARSIFQCSIPDCRDRRVGGRRRRCNGKRGGGRWRIALRRGSFLREK